MLEFRDHITLHSGEKTFWKIECDSLTDIQVDWLCDMIFRASFPFRRALGVPRGGERFANKLNIMLTRTAIPQNSPLLIVDDVYTTGKSIQDFLLNFPKYQVDTAKIAVAFSRTRDIPDNVYAAFTILEGKKKE